MKILLKNKLQNTCNEFIISAVGLYYNDNKLDTKEVGQIVAKEDTILIKDRKGKYLRNLSTKEIIGALEALYEVC